MTDQVLYEQFNPQQKEAVELATDWYRGIELKRHKKPFFFLSGFAGTGKTTVAKHIAQMCTNDQNRVVYIAPTGKAASRLRLKGCGYAKTMHQFIYNVRGEDDEGDPIFVAKGSLDERPKLIVLDECRMVGRYDMERILDHDIPVLALGDIGQLDPVRAQVYFDEGTMNYLLTDIERNKGNIVRASMYVRGGAYLPYREYEDVKVRPGKPTMQDLLDHSGEDAVILCSRNDTRRHYNKLIREAKGFKGDMPNIGEKIKCTFNQHGHNFMNGEQAILLGFSDVPDYEREDGEGSNMVKAHIMSLTTMKAKQVKFNALCFMGKEEDREKARRAPGGFDYGSALTIHSAQGSEWPRVLLIEENLPNSPYEKVMYTGITRAIDHLMVFR